MTFIAIGSERLRSEYGVGHAGRPKKSWRLAVTLVVALALVAAPLSANPATAAAHPPTVISLTFDDGWETQTTAVSLLKKYNMKGTFFINSGTIGMPLYMTRANLDQIKADGNEIGGHGVTHPDLAVASDAEAIRQVCDDRATLSSWGFAVRNFAYPFASSTPANETVVKNCGYNSARMLGDIRSRFGCVTCTYAESFTPANLYYTKALDQVERTWTLADLKASVTNAESSGGGWVQYTFHKVCPGGCDLGVTPTVLEQFMAWLAPRAASNNTVVKTVGDVIGGTVKPIVSSPGTPAPGPGVNGLVNPSLEQRTGSTPPTCWTQGGYGTNTAAFTYPSPGRTGTTSANVSMSGYASGDAKLLPTFDLGTCAPTVTTGRTYSLRTWYTSTAVTQFAVYLRTTSGTWQYWTSSPWFGAAPTYAQAAWTTPPIPAGMNGISFGLSAFNNGQLRTDDYALYDTVGAPPITVVTVPPPAPGVNAIVNPSLETPGGSSVPTCWTQGGFGTNTPTFSYTAPGRTGSVAANLSVAGYTSGDAKLLPTLDSGTCAPGATPGATYSLRAWYNSTTATQFVVYLRTSAGTWQYWTSSPWFAASPTYTQAVWTSPAIPAGMTGISFGLNVFNNGQLTTDDYALYNTVGAPAP